MVICIFILKQVCTTEEEEQCAIVYEDECHSKDEQVARWLRKSNLIQVCDLEYREECQLKYEEKCQTV